jgi:hypothetical protein
VAYSSVGANNTVSIEAVVYTETGQQGTAFPVFTEAQILENVTLEDFRLQIAGRTGGSAMNFSIDNLKLIVDGSGGGNSGLVINSVTREVVNGSVSVTITWNSREGQTYSVLASEDLALAISRFGTSLMMVSKPPLAQM